MRGHSYSKFVLLPSASPHPHGGFVASFSKKRRKKLNDLPTCLKEQCVCVCVAVGGGRVGVRSRFKGWSFLAPKPERKSLFPLLCSLLLTYL